MMNICGKFPRNPFTKLLRHAKLVLC